MSERDGRMCSGVSVPPNPRETPNRGWIVCRALSFLTAVAILAGLTWVPRKRNT